MSPHYPKSETYYEYGTFKTSKYHNNNKPIIFFSGDVVLNNLFIKETALVSIWCFGTEQYSVFCIGNSRYWRPSLKTSESVTK